MKKFLCFILCGVLLLGLCSCEQSIAPLTWTEETQEKIKRDYAKYRNNDSMVDDVEIGAYFGTYQNDAVALFITSNEYYYDSIFEENVADVHFKFYNSQPIYVYNKGSFTPLREAYESGIVSKEDVKEIHNLHELGMDKELYDSVKCDYLEYYGDRVAEEDFEITYYFGTYQNDATAFIPVEDSLQCIVEQEIGGVHFTFPDSRTIYICHDKTIFRLKEAYEKGIVSKEDVKEIHDRFEERNEGGDHAGFERRNENEDIL